MMVSIVVIIAVVVVVVASRVNHLSGTVLHVEINCDLGLFIAIRKSINILILIIIN